MPQFRNRFGDAIAHTFRIGMPRVMPTIEGHLDDQGMPFVDLQLIPSRSALTALGRAGAGLRQCNDGTKGWTEA